MLYYLSNILKNVYILLVIISNPHSVNRIHIIVFLTKMSQNHTNPKVIEFPIVNICYFYYIWN